MELAGILYTYTTDDVTASVTSTNKNMSEMVYVYPRMCMG